MNNLYANEFDNRKNNNFPEKYNNFDSGGNSTCVEEAETVIKNVPRGKVFFSRVLSDFQRTYCSKLHSLSQRLKDEV